MSREAIIENLEKKFLAKEKPEFKVGDTVKVHCTIKEGQKERLQMFMGTVIAKKGKGISETFSVYRSAYGSCMERVFILNSPFIKKIEVTKKGKIGRAKLYYIRGESGKRAKIEETFEKRVKEKSEEEKIQESK